MLSLRASETPRESRSARPTGAGDDLGRPRHGRQSALSGQVDPAVPVRPDLLPRPAPPQRPRQLLELLRLAGPFRHRQQPLEPARVGLALRQPRRSNLAAAAPRALHPRRLRCQQGLVPEEVQMPPRTPVRVMPLRRRATDRAGIGPSVRRVIRSRCPAKIELRLADRPRRADSSACWRHASKVRELGGAAFRRKRGQGRI